MARKIKRNESLQQEILELFENFLVENNAYSQYTTYIQEENHITFSELFDYCSKFGPYKLIPFYFIYFLAIFSYNKDGFEFWLDLHLKWNKIYKQYLQNFS